MSNRFCGCYRWRCLYRELCRGSGGSGGEKLIYRLALIINADKRRLLYEQLTYKIRGAMYAVHTALGPGHKESLYQKALAKELEVRGIPFIREKALLISYKEEKVGVYLPDFVVDEKVVIEVKAVPFLANNAEVQLSYYLRGTDYKSV